MREILFRGKRIDNGKWVEGDLLYNRIDGRENERRIGDIYFTQGEKIEGTAVYNVIPETVGQYTGLIDKNGKKIFEGDIFKTKTNDIFIIGFGAYFPKDYCLYRFWEYECWGLFAYDRKKQYQLSNNPNLFEVIGNIHDNPELLSKA